MDFNQQQELMSLYSANSLARKPFGERISFSESGVSPVNIPERFKIRNFRPIQGLDLRKLSTSISRDLSKQGITDRVYVSQVISGLCEAVKNAYEHGNKEEGSKDIFFAKCYERKNIEFLVGDCGNELNGHFIPFVLLFRQKGEKSFFGNIPDFYSFSGEMYAPQGHSGVGTKTMHIGFDDVRYFVSPFGGLLVYLSRNFPNVL